MYRQRVLICLILVIVIVKVNSDLYYIIDRGCNTCVKRGPPFCKQWCIITVHVGCCLQRRYACCSYREKPGVCPANEPSCSKPYPYYSTRMYECQHDFHCPLDYKCCSDCCFAHKICKKIQTARPTLPPYPKPSIFTTPTTTTTRTITTTTTTTSTTMAPTTLSTTTEFIIEVPDIVFEPTIVIENSSPTTLPNKEVVEGSGYGNHDLEEPHAALIGEMFDDEDFQH